MTLYENKTISQKEIHKLISDGCINATTGEYVDLLKTKKEKQFIKLHYNFIMINKEINHSFILKKIGVAYYGYLCLLMNNIHTDNSISYDLLGLNNAGLNKLKGILKKEGIVKYAKFGNMKTSKYFLNPLFSSYSGTIDYELFELFKEDNKKMFGISKL